MHWRTHRPDRSEGASTLLAITISTLAIACTPTVQLQAPEEPIRFDVNVKVTEEKRVQIDRAVLDLIEKNPQLFGFQPGEVPGARTEPSETSSREASSEPDSNVQRGPDAESGSGSRSDSP